MQRPHRCQTEPDDQKCLSPRDALTPNLTLNLTLMLNLTLTLNLTAHLRFSDPPAGLSL